MLWERMWTVTEMLLLLPHMEHREPRNLVHPVKFVVENPTVNRDTCLQVLREMQSILISRGFENGFTIPAN